jgi:N-acetylmuramoyl-L-alanine amidase
VGRAGFAVLKAVDIPAVLIETGFMTNPVEERDLQQELTQERIAGAIFRGLSTYCDADERCPRRTRDENTYVVAPGDSLRLIAARLGVSVSDLRNENALQSGTLQIGQKLKVPL